NNESKAYIVFKYLFLIAACIFVLIPLYPIVLTAFKQAQEVRENGFLTLPNSWTNFYNFQQIFKVNNFASAFLNTAIIMVISLTISTMLTCMVAYVLHRFEFKGKKGVMLLFVVTMFIPLVTTQVVTFRIIYALGLLDTIWSLIILYSGTDIVGLFIIMQVLDSIPKSIDESGYIDGASYFKIFKDLILPLLKPGIVTLVMIKGVGLYNDFYLPNIYLPSQKITTVATSLYAFMGRQGNSWELICAAVLVIVIPTLIIFLALQKYFYDGFVSGSVK
ncbi:MAG: carbohydrate ABC transporter permease, partial [Bacilli bacterium]